MNVSTSGFDRRPGRRVLRCLLVSTIVLPGIALSEPPAWAPAHGLRARHGAPYTGYSGQVWVSDYGVRSGRCDREQVGALLGGVAGGAIGAGAGKDGNRAVAIAIGTVIGAAIGAEIGRGMDDSDRACTGHALELALAGQSVTWLNPDSRVTYRLTPIDREASADGCRRFRLIATGAFGLSEGRATACPTGNGTWSLAPEAMLTRR
jgi:surface antigen